MTYRIDTSITSIMSFISFHELQFLFYNFLFLNSSTLQFYKYFLQACLESSYKQIVLSSGFPRELLLSSLLHLFCYLPNHGLYHHFTDLLFFNFMVYNLLSMVYSSFFLGAKFLFFGIFEKAIWRSQKLFFSKSLDQKSELQKK